MQKKAILTVYGLFSILGLLGTVFGVLVLILPLADILPGWAIADLVVGGLFFFFAGIYGIFSNVSNVSIYRYKKSASVKEENASVNNHDARYWLQKFLDENRS
ncbi:MAG: hypothetical protein Q7S57_05330 [bacterium]|nr:hypothetical protein [bacterium]